MKITSVVKCEGRNDTLVWKYPEEDFNTLTQLIVDESQEAIFYKDGQALDSFGPGRYTLTTENIPILGKLINLPFEGVSPFHCKVYFINLTEATTVPWGTSSRVQFTDPRRPHLQLSIGASGDLFMRVVDGRKLLIKLLGTGGAYTSSDFMRAIRGIVDKQVKSYLGQAMSAGRFDIFSIEGHLDEISEDVQGLLVDSFDEYGLEITQFNVRNIAEPLDNPAYLREKQLNAREAQDIRDAEIRANTEIAGKRIREVQSAAIGAEAAVYNKQKTVTDATAAAQADAILGAGRAESRRQQGYTYQDERGFDVASAAASNEGVGEFTNMGIGMGMIAGVSAPIAGGVADMTNAAMDSVMGGRVAQPAQTEDRQAQSTQTAQDPLRDFKVRIEKLVAMRDAGLLSDEEFEAQRQKLISEI
jgi:membrane protease subunit (stomatin/prohibitin family)